MDILFGRCGLGMGTHIRFFYLSKDAAILFHMLVFKIQRILSILYLIGVDTDKSYLQVQIPA